MALKKVALEIGMGTDIRGGDYTKAAVRALRDALWHNSLTVATALGKSSDDMVVEVLIGVPQPDKVDTAQVLAWVQESFGPIPRPARVLEPTYTLDPAQDGERFATVRRVGGAPLIYIGYHVPPGPHQLDVEFLDASGRSLPGLRQVRDIVVPPAGECCSRLKCCSTPDPSSCGAR
jgi:hypothetical protein